MLFETLGAVMILYHPDINLVKVNVVNLSKQVGILYMIDNTPGIENSEIVDLCSNIKNIHYLPQKTNLGIAEAQNIGISQVFNLLEFEFVILFDQDSEPDSHMIEYLMGAYEDLKKDNSIKISAVGALMINKDTNKIYKDRDLKKSYIYDSLIKKTEIMSSGSLISKEAIDRIGLMETELFIDGVDHEWCWRGNQLGYNCFVNEKALLLHKLGEGDKKLFGITIGISSPKRTFYQFRNFIVLAKRSYVPVSWKVINFVKYSIKIFYFPLFVSPRIEYLKNILLGIKEGVQINCKKKST